MCCWFAMNWLHRPSRLSSNLDNRTESIAMITTDVSETRQRGTWEILFSRGIWRYWKTTVWMNRCGITRSSLPPPNRFENPAFRSQQPIRPAAHRCWSSRLRHQFREIWHWVLLSINNGSHWDKTSFQYLHSLPSFLQWFSSCWFRLDPWGCLNPA